MDSLSGDNLTGIQYRASLILKDHDLSNYDLYVNLDASNVAYNYTPIEITFYIEVQDQKDAMLLRLKGFDVCT